MAVFRQWVHAQLSRLDGGRERKIVAFGAMGLLIFLSVGPTVLQAVAHAAASRAVTEEAPQPRTVVTVIQAPAQDPPSEDASGEAETPVPEPPAAPALSVPPLAFLFPHAGASLAGPTALAVRLESATAVAVLFEVTDPAGQRVATLPASPSPSGEWSALFAAAPGHYVVAVRASLDDGRVVSFKERRAFLLVVTETSPVPADPSEPVIELLAPDSKNGAYDAIAPLAARVKNTQPNALVFIVTSASGDETLVLGSETTSSGYWTAMFEGADGGYRVRARATIGERDVFSPESAFTIKTAAD